MGNFIARAFVAMWVTITFRSVKFCAGYLAYKDAVFLINLRWVTKTICHTVSSEYLDEVCFLFLLMAELFIVDEIGNTDFLFSYASLGTGPMDAEIMSGKTLWWTYFSIMVYLLITLLLVFVMSSNLYTKLVIKNVLLRRSAITGVTSHIGNVKLAKHLCCTSTFSGNARDGIIRW